MFISIVITTRGPNSAAYLLNYFLSHEYIRYDIRYKH